MVGGGGKAENRTTLSTVPVCLITLEILSNTEIIFNQFKLPLSNTKITFNQFKLLEFHSVRLVFGLSLDNYSYK